MAQQHDEQNTPPTAQPGAVDDVTALNQAFPGSQGERRKASRVKYQVVATLESVATGPEDVQVVTRDASAHGTGFLSSGELAEGSRAVLHLPSPEGDGETQRIECRVRRSREIGNGLFEGSVEFLGEQPQFSDTRIRPAPPRRAPATPQQ
jgi:hypothetical protein